MEAIKKKYIVDENQQKVAVQIDIDDFTKIEQVLEDYALGRLIQENDSADALTTDEAQKIYSGMEKGLRSEYLNPEKVSQRLS